ncbi:HIG1 domain family member 1A, mitochondrial-like [Odontomachus brunneus]|uniref:HIG1 domain family member 1A, mitochondrial-like n=1 Tax=Odontomachus brunneus TaxID=486640 RepID=UPI0013F1B629|nr:HIG1 domain family member 1A, mitochondrial-like [Odontomachus brunneus]XP_032690550.1 HIG1 domain family member 1A, mitochondrial-like [Odontomachus brunneus]
MADSDDMVVEQSLTDRLVEKSKKSPFLMAGLASLTGICAYGAYNFKKRQISTQLYLTQLRVVAQGTAVAFLTLGMVYHMIRKHVLHDEKEP